MATPLRRPALALVAALLLSGCGGAANQADEAGASKASASAARASASAATKAAALKDYRSCAATFDPFYTKLHELDSRLNVGLTQSDYNTALGDARVPYDDATPHLDGLSQGCLDAGSQLEQAFNRYIDANTYWANCIQGDYCTVDETRLQSNWSPAHNALTRYENQLAALKP